MALTILSALPDAPNYDVKILATDIDTNVIAKGLAASYAEELVDAIPTSVRSKWMERDPDEPRNWRMGRRRAPWSLSSR